MPDLQHEKDILRRHYTALDTAKIEAIGDVMAAATTPDYRWRGFHPFNEITGAEAVAEQFWMPLRESFTAMQRRLDVFMAGENPSPVSRASGWFPWGI